MDSLIDGRAIASVLGVVIGAMFAAVCRSADRPVGMRGGGSRIVRVTTTLDNQSRDVDIGALADSELVKDLPAPDDENAPILCSLPFTMGQFDDFMSTASRKSKPLSSALSALEVADMMRDAPHAEHNAKIVCDHAAEVLADASRGVHTLVRAVELGRLSGSEFQDVFAAARALRDESVELYKTSARTLVKSQLLNGRVGKDELRYRIYRSISLDLRPTRMMPKLTRNEIELTGRSKENTLPDGFDLSRYNGMVTSLDSVMPVALDGAQIVYPEGVKSVKLWSPVSWVDTSVMEPEAITNLRSVASTLESLTISLQYRTSGQFPDNPLTVLGVLPDLKNLRNLEITDDDRVPDNYEPKVADWLSVLRQLTELTSVKLSLAKVTAEEPEVTVVVARSGGLLRDICGRREIYTSENRRGDVEMFRKTVRDLPKLTSIHIHPFVLVLTPAEFLELGGDLIKSNSQLHDGWAWPFPRVIWTEDANGVTVRMLPFTSNRINERSRDLMRHHKTFFDEMYRQSIKFDATGRLTLRANALRSVQDKLLLVLDQIGRLRHDDGLYEEEVDGFYEEGDEED